MREVQLFIKGSPTSDYVKVDLFDDESISLTQTIKNAQDVSKIFTDFSKSFTIPASKTNSKLFKHYEKFVIDNGFDARKRVDARIEINRVPFKYGRVRLDGVELKDGAANAYKITFFGNTIKLKDAIGEEKLSALDLSQYDRTYSQSNIKTGLLADPETTNIIVPLITSSQRLTYGSGTGANTGDLKPGGNNGVLWSELKYAIRVDEIVQAIAERYGFTYSADSFFNHTEEEPNLPYYNLFMWLHRKKGSLFSQITQEPLSQLITGFVGIKDDEFVYTNAAGSIITLNDITGLVTFELNILNPSATKYTVTIKRDGEDQIVRRDITSTNQTISVEAYARNNSGYEVLLNADASTSFTFTWTAVNATRTETFDVTLNPGTDAAFNIGEQIPEMKVMDFLSALFKMFNLVATVDENNVVTVKTLDDYYAEGLVRDITKYVHNDSGSVDAAIPYAEINLKYKDTETILAKQFDQIKNREWGSDTYNTDDNLKEGGTFSLEVPFSHMQYERLPDLSTIPNNLTNVMYGFYVDDNQDPYLGAPLVFYPILNPLGDYSISYITDQDADGDFLSPETISNTSIIIPSNAVYVSEYIDTDNIHFFPEASEYYPNYAPYKTLFYNYHWNYTASLFNFRKRMTKIKATLPVNFLINYSLADTLIYKGLSYRINSISTNLNNGESSLELLNVVNVARPVYVGPSSSTTSSTTEPPAPTLNVLISGNTEPQEQTQQTYSAIVGGTATGAITYSWSVVNGTIVGSSTGSTVDILWDEVASNTAGSVSVSITRQGLNEDNTLGVTIVDTTVSFGISITQNGSTNLTTPVAQNDVITYGAISSGNATGTITYDWTVVGGTFTGEGTSSITVTWTTPGSGSIRVDAVRQGISAFDQDPIEVTATAASISVYARTPLENFNMTVQASVNGNPYQNVLSGTATSVCSLIGTISGLQGGDSVVVRIIETGVPGEKPINANNTTSCPTSVAGASTTYSYGTVSVGSNNLAVIIDNIPTIYTLDLGYAPYITEPPALTACQRATFGPLTEVYVDSTDIQSITRFYDDATGTSFSPSTGYYSDGVYAIEWDGTAVVNEVLCAAQTTTTSDPSQNLLSGYDVNTGTGWTTALNACSAPEEDVVRALYHISNSLTVVVGTPVYTDNALTSPLVGGNLWYHYYEGASITPTAALQINNSGVIVAISNC